MIVHDRFPWLSHLSLAEIEERDWLRERKSKRLLRVDTSPAWRLRVYEARSVVIPPESEPPAAA